MSGCDGTIDTIGSCEGSIGTIGSCDGAISALSCCDPETPTFAAFEDAFTLVFGMGFVTTSQALLAIDETQVGGFPPNSDIVLEDVEPGPAPSGSGAEPPVFVGATLLSQGGSESTQVFNENENEPPDDTGGDNVTKTSGGIAGGGDASVIVPD